MAREDSFQQVRYAGSVAASERITGFLRGVYGWMATGLAITAIVAYFVASSPVLIETIFTNQLLFWGVVIAQFGIVFYLSARVQRLAPATASLLFMVYAALTGLTLSIILVAYTGESVAMTFLVTAGMFGAMAAYGTMTKRDLSGWGQFLFMGLIGVFIAMIVGIFWQSSALQFMISFIGVIVFTGLAAYDANRLRSMALSLPDGQVGAYTVVGALSMYLNFINLFLMLLRFFGGRRD
jgi:uncharacterized protein